MTTENGQMDWIPALFKHLAIARSAVVAAFVTAAIWLFAPRIAPDFLPPATKEWMPGLVSVFLFCGCLLLIWACEAIWSGASRIVAKMKASRRLKSVLNRDERTFLYALGQCPADSLNLDDIDYASTPFTRLELLEVVGALADKGLVETNMYAANLVSLTDEGRKRSLVLHRTQSLRA